MDRLASLGCSEGRVGNAVVRCPVAGCMLAPYFLSDRRLILARLSSRHLLKDRVLIAEPHVPNAATRWLSSFALPDRAHETARLARQNTSAEAAIHGLSAFLTVRSVSDGD